MNHGGFGLSSRSSFDVSDIRRKISNFPSLNVESPKTLQGKNGGHKNKITEVCYYL